ncbi:GAF domain-containing protein [Prevotella sp. oral taxon 376]|uniref:GAF domain-containing protein n=1 Tax=Prevotella sp. oral taxon 376 TaxID=712466 RepID=UPI000D1E3E4E|nr:GAF domain-containing protein [Prevotella sp. oral taxon 376]PTL33335.1 GAF domain-containing protein [Prevotella sp. oral taxon 376]
METKEEKYRLLCAQVKSLVAGENNLTGALSNVSAAMRAAFPDVYWWVGFYLVRGGELQLGPFQGPVACMTIRKGKGVCGTAWVLNSTVVVPDVECFPGHIACSSESRSEIVVPIRNDGGEVVAEIDVDSRELAAFDEVDRLCLENISKILSAELEF